MILNHACLPVSPLGLIRAEGVEPPSTGFEPVASASCATPAHAAEGIRTLDLLVESQMS